MKEREKFIRRSHIKLIKFPKILRMFEMFFFLVLFPRNLLQENSIKLHWVIEQSGFEYMGMEEDKLLIQCPFRVISCGLRIYLRHTQNKFNSFLSTWVVIAHAEILYMRVLPT